VKRRFRRRLTLALIFLALAALIAMSIFLMISKLPAVAAAVPQLTVVSTADYWNFSSSSNRYQIDWSTAAQGWYAGTIAHMYDMDSGYPNVDFSSPRATFAQKNPACWAFIGAWKSSASAAGGAASYARNTTPLNFSNGGMPVVATVTVGSEWNVVAGFEYKWNMSIWNDGVVFVQDKWYRDGDGLGRGATFLYQAAIGTASAEGPTGDYYVYAASAHPTTPVHDIIVVAKTTQADFITALAPEVSSTYERISWRTPDANAYGDAAGKVVNWVYWWNINNGTVGTTSTARIRRENFYSPASAVVTSQGDTGSGLNYTVGAYQFTEGGDGGISFYLKANSYMYYYPRFVVKGWTGTNANFKLYMNGTQKTNNTDFLAHVDEARDILYVWYNGNLGAGSTTAFVLGGGMCVVWNTATNPFAFQRYQWINFTAWHSDGWANFEIINIEINTTGAAQTFTLQWNATDFSLVEYYDPNSICTLGAWSNSTAGNNVTLRISISLSTAAKFGWCSELINGTATAYSPLLWYTPSLFYLGGPASELVQNGGFETGQNILFPWGYTRNVYSTAAMQENYWTIVASESGSGYTKYAGAYSLFLKTYWGNSYGQVNQTFPAGRGGNITSNITFAEIHTSAATYNSYGYRCVFDLRFLSGGPMGSEVYELCYRWGRGSAEPGVNKTIDLNGSAGTWYLWNRNLSLDIGATWGFAFDHIQVVYKSISTGASGARTDGLDSVSLQGFPGNFGLVSAKPNPWYVWYSTAPQSNATINFTVFHLLGWDNISIVDMRFTTVTGQYATYRWARTSDTCTEIVDASGICSLSSWSKSGAGRYLSIVLCLAFASPPAAGGNATITVNGTADAYSPYTGYATTTVIIAYHGVAMPVQLVEYDRYSAYNPNIAFANATVGGDAAINVTHTVSYGEAIISVSFDTEWLEGKTICIRWQGITVGAAGAWVIVKDGYYLRSSSADFPDNQNIEDRMKGEGYCYLYGKLANFAKEWYNLTVYVAPQNGKGLRSFSRLGNTTVWINLREYSGGTTKICVYDFLVKDSLGEVLWQADIGISGHNGFIWPEGNRGAATREFGRFHAIVSPEVSVPYYWFRGQYESLNVTWRVGGTTAIDIGVNTSTGQYFLLKWSSGGYTLTESADPDGICTLSTWTNTTSLNQVALTIYLQITNPADAGWCGVWSNITTSDLGALPAWFSRYGFILVCETSYWEYPTLSYRRQHNITGSTWGDLTNYQMNFTVIAGNGISSGHHIYLNGTGGRADFGDVRWTMWTSMPMDYWIEQVNSGLNASFWVEIPFIPKYPSVATIYVYWGNASETNISSGQATFIFFDHFTGAALNGTKWDTLAGVPSVSGSILTLTAATVEAKAAYAVYTQYEGKRIRARTNVSNDVWYFTALGARQSGSWNNQIRFTREFEPDSKSAVTGESASIQRTSGMPFVYGSYVLYTINWWYPNSSQKAAYFYFPDYSTTHGTVRATHTQYVPTRSVPLELYLDSSGNNPTVKCDWIFVGLFVRPEPADGGWGAVEIYISLSFAEVDTNPFYVNLSGWLNVTVSDNMGWGSIQYVDIQINTTGDAQTFTLRWNASGYTLTEQEDLDSVCTVNQWWNSSAGNDLNITINVTITTPATVGWCDKALNATDAAGYKYESFVAVFELRGVYWISVQSETSPLGVGDEGWLNVTFARAAAGFPYGYADIRLNTSGAGETVTVRWNSSDYTLSEVNDPLNIFTIGSWTNTTGATTVLLKINLTFAWGTTAGMVDKDITWWDVKNASYNVILLYYAFGTVEIRVLDNATHIPIPGALVWMWNGTWADSQTTPPSGYVWFANILNGTYTINGTIYSHQTNTTTIPTANESLIGPTWNLYLKAYSGTWKYVRAVDNVTKIGIPHASIGFGNASFSIILPANCTGWSWFWVVDGNYDINASAPYWYVTASAGGTAFPPNARVLNLTWARISFPADIPSPWGWYIDYADPWSTLVAGPGNLSYNATFTDLVRAWIWKSEIVFISSTTALIRMVYTTPLNSTCITFQTRTPPTDDVPVNLWGWGPDWANYSRQVNGYCDHGSNMTMNEDYPTGGSVWYYLLDNLYPGKLYYFTIYPGISIYNYANTHYFRTQPASQVEYATAFGNGSSSWLYVNALMDFWGERVNLSAYKPSVYGGGYAWKWDRATWDHYWYGDHCANATGLTNLYATYGNNSDVLSTARIAIQARNTSLWFDWGDGSNKTEPFYVVPAKAHASEPYTGEGVSFGLYDPQLDKYLFRIALGNISGPVAGSYSCGIFAWDGALERWERTTDYLHGGPKWYGDWRCYNTWWNVTVKIPKEAWCANDPEYWNYEYTVYISGPVATNSEQNFNATVGSFPLGTYFCDGLFAVFEYIPDLREVTDHYFGIPPNNINASWDFARIANCTLNMTHMLLEGEWNTTIPPNESPADGEGEGPYGSLYPTYYSQNIVARLYTYGTGPPWHDSGWPLYPIAATYGTIKDCTYIDLFGTKRNRVAARENNITNPYTMIHTWPWNCTYFWFDLNSTEGQRFKSLAKEPIASWPTRWLVVGLCASGGGMWTSYYIDMVYLNSGSSWITVAYANNTAGMTQGTIWVWAWNGTTHPVVLGGGGYYGQWDTQTFRANLSVASYNANQVYRFAGYDYRIDIPPAWIGCENMTAWPDKMSLTAATKDVWPWGEASNTPHQLKAFDMYHWYASYSEIWHPNSSLYPSQGTMWWANNTGWPGNLSLPGNESYINFQKQSTVDWEYWNERGIFGIYNDLYAEKVLFLRWLNGSISFGIMPRGGEGGALFDYYVLGVNDTNSLPLLTDHTYYQGRVTPTPTWDDHYYLAGNRYWNYTLMPCHVESNVTLPDEFVDVAIGGNESRVVYPKIAVWDPTTTDHRMGRWSVDWYQDWWVGNLQNDTEAGYHAALYAVDVFYYVAGITYTPGSHWTGGVYYTGDAGANGECVLMANATQLNHTNPLEPVLQLAFVDSGTDTGINLNKVSAWYNESGVYWAFEQVFFGKSRASIKVQPEGVWRYGMWKYDMSGLDYDPTPEWSDHSYGREDIWPNLSTTTFYEWLNQTSYLTDAWDIIITNYSVANNVTEPNAYIGSNDFYAPIGVTRGQTAEGVWLLPDWNSYGMDWTAVGTYNNSDFPYWWKAVDFFRRNPSAPVREHSRSFDAWAGTGGSGVGSEREGVWDVATFFFNMSSPNLTTPDQYPVLEFQVRSAAVWDLNDQEKPLIDKVGIVMNGTTPGGTIVYFSHAYLNIGYPGNHKLVYTMLTKACAYPDATPQWNDHSYMAHGEQWANWYTTESGTQAQRQYRLGGSGWNQIPLNWSNSPDNNATMPPGWTDAQFTAGQIYNETAWAGWCEVGGSDDDPMIWEMTLPMVAVDEFYDYREWYTWPGFCGWEAWGGDASYPLNFAINGTWADLSRYSAWLGAYQYVLFMADDLGTDANIFPDKIWFLANSTHFQMAYRMLNGNSQDESPVLLAMNASLGDGEGHLRRNSTSWPEVWTLDVVDFGDIYGYKASWSIYTWDLRHVGLPDHDDTCPMTKFDWPNLTFFPSRAGGFNKWILENWGDVSMVDGREGHAMKYSTWGTKTVVYFNTSLFSGVGTAYTWVAIVYDTSLVIYPNAFAMKVNASGNWVGYYIHGAHNGGHVPFVQADFTQFMTPYLTSHTIANGDLYGSETFDFTGETMNFYINHTDIPHNGRWIWFRVVFVRILFARISYRTNDWTSPSAFDYYETIPVYFLKEVDYIGISAPPQYLVFKNSTGAEVYGLDIREWPDNIWNHLGVERGTLPAGTYNVSIIGGASNATYYTRVLYVYRWALSWELTCTRWVYGGASKFTFRGFNWRYWSEELYGGGYIRRNTTEPKGELQCTLVATLLSTGVELGRISFTMYNDSKSHELRNIVSEAMPLILPNPGIGGRDVNITVYTMLDDGSWVVLWGPSGATLQSVAIYGDVFEDLGAWLGFGQNFTRMLVALFLTCMIAVGFGHVARMGALGHCVMILIGFWMFTLAGWFPAFFAGIATLAVVGSLMWSRGGGS